MNAASDAERVYGGRSASQRRADRRGRLVTAGLDLFGDVGFAGSSIERLCAQATVSTRYFYEEFADRAALLRAVYDEVLAEAVRVALLPVLDPDPGLDPAERTERAVRAYVAAVTTDPRRARVVHREIRVVASLEAHRRTTINGIAVQVRESVGPGAPDQEQTWWVQSLALIGAVSEVLALWTAAPDPRPPIGPVTDVLVEFCARTLAGVFASD